MLRVISGVLCERQPVRGGEIVPMQLSWREKTTLAS